MFVYTIAHYTTCLENLGYDNIRIKAQKAIAKHKINNMIIFSPFYAKHHYEKYPAWLLKYTEQVTKFYTVFFNNPEFLNIGAKIIIFLEAIFIIGFFTKKYDNWLIASLIIIHIFTYLFVDALFIELCILIFSLLSKQFMEKINYHLPLLNKQTLF